MRCKIGPRLTEEMRLKVFTTGGEKRFYHRNVFTESTFPHVKVEHKAANKNSITFYT